MSAGSPSTEPAPCSATERDPGAARIAALEAQVGALRASNLALKEQLTLRDLALDATSTFFVISRLTSDEPIMVYCNQVVADQHGCNREQLIGRPVTVMYERSPRPPNHRAQVNAALLKGMSYHYESEVMRSDGSLYWVGITLQPIFDAAGRLTHSVAIGADITAKREEALKKQELQRKLHAQMQERERMALELQLAQKLESVGRLAAGLAHEINTPIQYVGDNIQFLRGAYADIRELTTAIQQALTPSNASLERRPLIDQLTEMMQRYDADYLHAEIPKAFDQTMEGVARVTSIVKAMKEFAHPATDEQSPTDINHALETTLLVASNEYKYLAQVRTDFAALPDLVCNVSELNQVFLNLIVNAAHAIQDAGKDSNCGEIRICTSLEEDSVVISIRDNGCGIPAEHLTRIYDPFFTTKEVGRGTGQGLAIAHSIIVEKHRGSISARSELGAGTEVTLRLPVGGRKSASA